MKKMTCARADTLFAQMRTGRVIDREDTEWLGDHCTKCQECSQLLQIYQPSVGVS